MTNVNDSHTSLVPGKSPRWIYYGLLLVVAAAIAIYLPGITGPFIHDDTGRITGNDGIKITELSVDNLLHSTQNMPSRPLPMMSFALNYYQCGQEATCFKSTNIFIHAATGLALFLFLTLLGKAGAKRRLFEFPTWLPLLVTAVWLLHPLNVSTVLYAVQRMTQLSLLCSLLFLACWLQARFLTDKHAARAGWTLAGLVFLALGLASKENAVLALPTAALLELLLLPTTIRQRITRPLLAGWLLAALAFVALALLAVFPPKLVVSTYLSRDFLPVERVLSEARILWYYTSEIFWPDAARMSFFLDFLPVSRSLLDPWTTLPAALGWFLVAGAALAALLRGPSLVGFGVLFFLVNHAMESSLYGLILSYEHRNYSPMIGALLAVTALAYNALRVNALRTGTAALVLSLCSWQLIERVATWSSEAALASHFQSPRFAASYAGTLEYAAYYAREASRMADNPTMARLYQQKAVESFRHAAPLSQQPFAALSFLIMQTGSSPEEKDGYWQALQQTAKQQPANNDALNFTNVMASCLLVPQCPVSRARFAEYIDLLIAQPRTSSSTRNKLRRTAGTFYTRVMGDPEKGLPLARQAAAFGLPEARESLVKNLAYAGRQDEARQEYEKLLREGTVDEQRRQRIEQALSQPQALPLW